MDSFVMPGAGNLKTKKFKMHFFYFEIWFWGNGYICEFQKEQLRQNKTILDGFLFLQMQNKDDYNRVLVDAPQLPPPSIVPSLFKLSFSVKGFVTKVLTLFCVKTFF